MSIKGEQNEKIEQVSKSVLHSIQGGALKKRSLMYEINRKNPRVVTNKYSYYNNYTSTHQTGFPLLPEPMCNKVED